LRRRNITVCYVHKRGKQGRQSILAGTKENILRRKTAKWQKCKMIQLLWKISLVVYQKGKHRITTWASNSPSVINPKGAKKWALQQTHEHTCS
jgi:hypothetical protein